MPAAFSKRSQNIKKKLLSKVVYSLEMYQERENPSEESYLLNTLSLGSC